MSRIDLHPEELLHRYRLGVLNPEERARLAAHCVSCTVCELERRVADGMPEALKVTDADREAAALAIAALGLGSGESVEGVEPSADSLPKVAPRGEMAGRKRRMAAIAAVATLFTAGAAAALVYRGGLGTAEEAASSDASGRAAGAPAEAPVEPELSVPPVDPASLLERDESDVGIGEDTVSELESGTLSRHRVASAQVLFSRANEARRRNRIEASVAAYDHLLRRYPSSREAHASKVLLARVLQRDDRRSRALALLGDYLRETPSGNLAPEARRSRARILQQLGRRGAARSAWQEVLSRDADSPYADEARRALLTLRGAE